MSDEMTPSGADQTPEPVTPAPSGGSATETGAEAAGSAGAGTSAAAMIPSDTTSRMIITSGLATAIIALIGGVAGAWRMDYLGLVLILVGLAAAGVAWAGATGIVRIDALPGRDIELAAGIVAGVLSVLNLLETLFDLDHLDDHGGAVGTILGIALAVAALALFAGVVRRWTSPREVLMSGDRGTRLAYAGVGLVIVGWLAMVTLSFWESWVGVGALTFVILAGVVLRWASDPASKRLPIAGAWIAVVLAALATVVGVDHLREAVEQGDVFGPIDWLVLLAYLAGVALTLIGSIWTAYERTMDAQERSTIGTGDVS
jgi:hypothetical protein